VRLLISSLDNDSKADTVQHLSSKSKINSAFLTANPSLYMGKTTNDVFAMVLHHRLILPVCASRTHCLCGDSGRKYWQHALCCKVMRIRNQTRYAFHNHIKDSVVQIIRHLSSVHDLGLLIGLN
jgi:hypothetical protein